LTGLYFWDLQHSVDLILFPLDMPGECLPLGEKLKKTIVNNADSLYGVANLIIRRRAG